MIEITKDDAAYKVSAFDGKDPYLTGWLIYDRHTKAWQYRPNEGGYLSAADLTEIVDFLDELNDET